MLDLHDYLSVGQNSMISQQVAESDTGAEYSEVLGELLATPTCIHMAIKAGIETIDPYLPEGFISVGISTRFVHTAPTSIGMTVTIRTSIIAIEEHDVLLEIKAWDEQGDIGHGQHKRAIISRSELEKKVNQRTRFLTNRSLR